ncbi:MAG: DNA-binding protein WhiA, partial [Bacilli bacterium]|nr:DNA-binding protein WhiA [Bacilli bacterium]
KQVKLKKHDLYYVQVAQKTEKLLSDLSLMNTNGLFFQDVDPKLIQNECCRKAYLRGAFLSSGSINNPDTSAYHLEIQTFSEKQAQVLADIANSFELKAKTAKNRRGFIVYIKEAEKISDFLRVTGATNSLFTFEDNRIKRDFKNSINRVINCDIANERKAMDAARKQLEEIAVVEKHLKTGIPKSMQEAIFLRKTYPEATLVELSYASLEHFGSQISKSALNHRFRAIKDLANQLEIEANNQ